MFQYIRRETKQSPGWFIFYILLGLGGGVYAYSEIGGAASKIVGFALATVLSFIGACVGGYIRRFTLPSRVHGGDMWELLVRKFGLYATPPILGCLAGGVRYRIDF